MKKALIILMFLLFLLIPVPANANSAPVKIVSAPPGFNLFPLRETLIEVENEKLNYNISKEDNTTNAYVTAEYSLKNNSNKTEIVTLAFPYIPGSLSLNKPPALIMFDGQTINYESINLHNIHFNNSNTTSEGLYSLKDYQAYTPSFDEILQEINSATIKGNDLSGDGIQVLIFKIEFSANSQHQLKITYYQSPGVNRDKNDVYYYFLEPAKYWANFQNLSICITLPPQYIINSSTLPLKKEYFEPVYRINTTTLPLANLEFQITSTKSRNIFYIIIIISVIIMVLYFKKNK